MIYLDSAATSFYRPPVVARAVAEAMNSMGNCSRGTHREALTGARIIFDKTASGRAVSCSRTAAGGIYG